MNREKYYKASKSLHGNSVGQQEEFGKGWHFLLIVSE